MKESERRGKKDRIEKGSWYRLLIIIYPSEVYCDCDKKF